jgi:hypothetical protein
MASLVSPDLLWLAEGLLASLLAGLVLALLVSGLLIARPRTLMELNRRLSRWVDTRDTLRVLERPLMLERLFYRHHRALGAGIVLGAGYVLWQWAFGFNRAALVGLIDPRWRANGLDWIVSAGEFVVVALHVLVLAVGAVILLRPSLLKGLEKRANHWYRGPSSEPLDRIVGTLDDGIAVYPRLSGLILLVATVWSLIALVPFFLQVLAR